MRYLDPGSALGYSYEQELYPNTRTSNAVGLRARYFLPYRAAIEAEYRFYVDTWDIQGHTASLTYVHPWNNWTFEIKGRFHDQTSAHFFQDVFPRAHATNFRGRDNENRGWGVFKKASVSASIDMLRVDYEEFRDLRFTGGVVGEEPLYALDANVIQFFVSFWY